MAYWDNVRQRRNEMRAARGAEPLPERRRSTGGADEDAPPAWDEMPGREEARGDEDHLQASQERESELGEAKRLIGELKDYAEQLQDRVVELIAGSEPMAKALLLPGVKTFLLQRFHPTNTPAPMSVSTPCLPRRCKPLPRPTPTPPSFRPPNDRLSRCLLFRSAAC